MGRRRPRRARPPRLDEGRRPSRLAVPVRPGGGAVTERRRDPLTGEWRTFATHRQDRTFLPAADACPLCPGPHSEIPPGAGGDIVVFENRFPSFTRNPPPPSVAATELYDVEPAV